MKFPGQQFFDTRQGAGINTSSSRVIVRNNPPDSPFFPTADDYGCASWTCDPADVTTAAQLSVSQTLYGSLLVVPTNTTANKISFAPHTVQGAETNFNGVGLYTFNSTFTTLSLVVASANQAGWTTITPDTIVDAPFTAATPIVGGYYISAWLGSTGGTAMTLHGELGTVASVLNFSKSSTVPASKYRSFTLAAQTTMPATITLSGVTASAFIPFMALS